MELIKLDFVALEVRIILEVNTYTLILCHNS